MLTGWPPKPQTLQPHFAPPLHPSKTHTPHMRARAPSSPQKTHLHHPPRLKGALLQQCAATSAIAHHPGVRRPRLALCQGPAQVGQVLGGVGRQLGVGAAPKLLRMSCWGWVGLDLIPCVRRAVYVLCMTGPGGRRPAAGGGSGATAPAPGVERMAGSSRVRSMHCTCLERPTDHKHLQGYPEQGWTSLLTKKRAIHCPSTAHPLQHCTTRQTPRAVKSPG